MSNDGAESTVETLRTAGWIALPYAVGVAAAAAWVSPTVSGPWGFVVVLTAGLFGMWSGAEMRDSVFRGGPGGE